ncbi:hypothetical protein RRF57_012809 [Xylaria bambusicola]|uniref:Uncharacterized protein n=1 Tax=Xylaria bambusicola TaxID=326684 RepID=A0AAN7ZB68_9PEZI
MSNIPTQQTQLDLPPRWQPLPQTWDQSAKAIVDQCAPLLREYFQLLRETTVPAGIASSNTGVTNAFKTLFDIIRQREGSILARVAYVQLQKVFTSVEALIRAERRSGLHGKSHNTTIAIGLFITAVGGAAIRKSDVMALRRKMRRWSYLAQPSIFFLMTYSDHAEPIV